jgi:hypothetical protein
MTDDTWNMTIKQGAKFFAELTISDDGTLRDLTGYTAKLQIRDNPAATDTLLELTSATGEGISILAGTGGKLDIEISSGSTAALDFLTAVYDLELTVTGETERLLSGVVTLSREVTK